MWFDWNLSCLLMVWNLTLYQLNVLPKFKLLTCDLKSHYANILLDSFWSYIFIYIYIYIFFFFVFFEERDIKVMQNYIFSTCLDLHLHFFLRSVFQQNLYFSSRSRALVTVLQTSFSAKLSLKMGSTILFIHLKIILLQYFQFSVK